MAASVYNMGMTVRTEELRTQLVAKYPQFSCYIDKCCMHFLKMESHQLFSWLWSERCHVDNTRAWHETALIECGISETFEKNASLKEIRNTVHLIGQLLIDSRGQQGI